jgi:hypothetical protein
MKKNYFIVFLSSFIIGLLFIKLGWPGGSLLIVLSTVLLIIGYTNKLIRYKSKPNDFNRIIIEISIYLIFTLIGILFRHQFWPFPYWNVLFKYIWPIFSLVIIVNLFKLIDIIKFKALTKEYRNGFLKDFLIPLVIFFILSIPTFFTTTNHFVKIFKHYSYEELMDRWNNEKK